MNKEEKAGTVWVLEEVLRAVKADEVTAIVVGVRRKNRTQMDHFEGSYEHLIHITTKHQARIVRELLEEEDLIECDEEEHLYKNWIEENRRKGEEIEHERRRVAAAKGRLTKVKNRVGNGVCPCCNRTFQNLMRHMHTKHPDYKKAES